MDRLLLKSEVKVNIILRLLTIPLTALMLIAFSDSLHDLIFLSHSLGDIIKLSFNVLILAFLFWPFSYIAIKGKSPKNWHPYQ